MARYRKYQVMGMIMEVINYPHDDFLMTQVMHKRISAARSVDHMQRLVDKLVAATSNQSLKNLYNATMASAKADLRLFLPAYAAVNTAYDTWTSVFTPIKAKASVFINRLRRGQHPSLNSVFAFLELALTIDDERANLEDAIDNLDIIYVRLRDRKQQVIDWYNAFLNPGGITDVNF